MSLNKCINFALCTRVCSNFDSCAYLKSFVLKTMSTSWKIPRLRFFYTPCKLEHFVSANVHVCTRKNAQVVTSLQTSCYKSVHVRLKVVLLFEMMYVKYSFLKGIHSVTWTNRNTRIGSNIPSPISPVMSHAKTCQTYLYSIPLRIRFWIPWAW